MSSTEVPSSSSAHIESDEKTEAVKKAAEFLAQGKRDVVCGEVPKAVNLFEEAIKLLVDHCGEMSKECADAYFSCGSALLDLGRMETNVLGAALEGVDVEEEKEETESEQFEKPPTEEGEERQKLREEVYEAMAEGEREELLQKARKEQSGASVHKAMSEAKEETESKDLESPVSMGVENEKESVKEAEDAEEEKSKVTVADAEVLEGENAGHEDKSSEEMSKTAESAQTEVEKESKEETDMLQGQCEASENKEDKNDMEKTEGNAVAEKEILLDRTNDILKESESTEKKMSDEKKDLSKETGSVVNEGGEKDPKCDDAATDEVEAEQAQNEKSGKENDVEMENAEGIKDDDANDDDAKDDDLKDEDDEEETAAGNGSQDEEPEDKEDDVGNFQLAWEHLDLARVIYLKGESRPDQLKAAECHIKLGEVSMETEQHATAAEDLQAALAIQQKHLPVDDRIIAETHYQLGLAYGLGKEFELSIQHYKLAIGVIEAKIASLSKLVEEKEVDAENKENRETDDLKTYKDEIKELREILPEMKNKIEDTRVEQRDMEKMKEMAKEMLGLTGTSKGFGSPTKKADASAASGSLTEVDENGEKKATDIAHLVRRKRKPDEEEVCASGQDLKKLRQEGGAAGDVAVVENGDAKAVNGTKHDAEENGDVEPMTS